MDGILELEWELTADEALKVRLVAELDGDDLLDEDMIVVDDEDRVECPELEDDVMLEEGEDGCTELLEEEVLIELVAEAG